MLNIFGGCNLLDKERICEICEEPFVIIDKGWTRKYCYNCSPHEDKDHNHAYCVSVKRRAIKNMLIRYAGGKCQHCGYDKCFRALEFHHTNPNEKDFGVSRNLTKSIASLKEEVDKCILLCSNCHAEEHDRLFREGYSQFDSDI